MSYFRALPLRAIKARGWLRQQMQDDLDYGFAGRLDALTERAATDLFARRIESSQSEYAWWDGETRGNWLWGYVMMAHLAEHPAHMARAGGLVEALLATQDPDGYIGIYGPESRYRHAPGENGELWSQGRALLILLAYYELTCRPDVLAAAERAAGLTMRQYGAGRRYFEPGASPYTGTTGLTHGLCYVDAMAWLYRLTGDPAYRDFGVWLYDDFCRMETPFPNDDMSARNVLDEGRPFAGHAVHTAEHLRTLLWAATVSERDDLKAVAARALAKLRRYLLPGGALIGDESIHGFPRPDMGYEYCTTTELLLSLTSAYGMSGEAWFGDVVEMLAFNAAQGARFADGRAVAYLAADTALSATRALPDSYGFLIDFSGRYKYSPTHEDVACCCAPNAVRLLPHYVAGLWRRTDDGLAAALYGACSVEVQVNGVRVRINEDTDYPFSDEVRMTITPDAPVEFALYLRRPGWVREMRVETDAETAQSNGHVVARKAWQAGDTVRIRLANAVRSAPYLTGEHAVFYGALQFALPIAHHERAIKAHPLPGFHDYDVLPENAAQAHTPLILNGAREGLGLAVQPDPDGDMLRPWHKPPIALAAGDARLIPLGCTVLRRAAFPVVE
ncbi:MAG: glycoside hydrolase family 127 protein [Anaerolineae bacterium]|nr:glycoside hydrolase family 127 protein [Anaerolineae bacterium]